MAESASENLCAWVRVCICECERLRACVPRTHVHVVARCLLFVACSHASQNMRPIAHVSTAKFTDESCNCK